MNTAYFLLENKKLSCVLEQEKTYSKQVLSIRNIHDFFKRTENNEDLKSDIFKKNYGFVDITLLNDKFTLIPEKYFEESLAEKFLNYNVPQDKTQGLRFNIIPQYETVLVYYYPEEIEEFFAGNSEKIRISHVGFKFLSKIKLSEKHKTAFYLNSYQEYFELVVIKDEKLLLYNVYPYAVVQDIIYYLKVVAQNINIKLSETSLYYFGNIEDTIGNLDKLSLEFKNVIPGVEDEYERRNFTILDTL